MFGKVPPSGRLQARVRQVTQERCYHPTPGPAPRQAARKTRRGVFKNATVILPNDERVSVVVRDLSDEGARIEFVQRRLLPSSFILCEPTMKLRRRVELVWQQDAAAGVRFRSD